MIRIFIKLIIDMVLFKLPAVKRSTSLLGNSYIAFSVLENRKDYLNTKINYRYQCILDLSAPNLVEYAHTQSLWHNRTKVFEVNYYDEDNLSSDCNISFKLKMIKALSRYKKYKWCRVFKLNWENLCTK